MESYQFGMIGLGVMGRNLALNVARHGYSVAGFDLDPEKAGAARQGFDPANMTVVYSLADLVSALAPPRRILMMVPAGRPVDSVIQELQPRLEQGDILIDGGNSFFLDTERRAKELDTLGIRYLGTGISGGEKGALIGPAIMPGGQEEAYRDVEPILTSIAAQVADGPCCTYIGPRGSGHYVKMVHNGIEYGIMQLICEAYDFLKSGLGLETREIQEIFESWNAGELSSFLVEITSVVLKKIDPETGLPLVELILDQAGQKGTGKWTSQNALDLGVAIPTINAAVEARILSAFKQERVAASELIEGPISSPIAGREAFISTVRDALRLAALICYAQGFALMREASKEYAYSLRPDEIARIWKGGCIIRAKVLDAVQAAFRQEPELPNLLVSPQFIPLVQELQPALQAVVGESARRGIPALAWSASLGYLDSYRQKRLPANLLQAHRDYFGAHTYRRIDKEGVFHTEWD